MPFNQDSFSIKWSKIVIRLCNPGVISRENRGYSIVFLESLFIPLILKNTTYDTFSLMKASAMLNTMAYKFQNQEQAEEFIWRF